MKKLISCEFDMDTGCVGLKWSSGRAAALDALDVFSEHWDKKYPKISQSWRANWANLSIYFKFPQEH